MRRLIASFEERVRQGAEEAAERASLRERGFTYVRTYTVRAHLRPRRRPPL
jgi:hypothetical protein